MADSLHKVITKFRDNFKNSIIETIDGKFAILESQLRDENIDTGKFVNQDQFTAFTSKLIPVIEDFVETKAKVDHLTTVNELKAVQHSPNTKNVVIEHQRVTNLTMPTPIPVVKMDVVPMWARPNEEVEIPDCESPTKFTPLEVDGTTYWLDNDHVVYKETDEGYEEIGSYDPETGEISIEDEDEDEETMEEVEEEEDEGVEAEEFKYKGKTYFRDGDNNVYNEDGEEVGTWTGSTIKFV